MKRPAGFVLCATIVFISILLTTIVVLSVVGVHKAFGETLMKEPDFPANYQSWQHTTIPCAVTEEKSFTLSVFGTIIPTGKEIQVVEVLRFGEKLISYQYLRGLEDRVSNAFIYFPVAEGFVKLDLQDKGDDEKIGNRMLMSLGIGDALAYVACEKNISPEKDKFFDMLFQELLEKAK